MKISNGEHYLDKRACGGPNKRHKDTLEYCMKNSSIDLGNWENIADDLPGIVRSPLRIANMEHTSKEDASPRRPILKAKA